MYTKSFNTRDEAGLFASGLFAAGKCPRIVVTSFFIVVWE